MNDGGVLYNFGKFEEERSMVNSVISSREIYKYGTCDELVLKSILYVVC